MHCGLDYEMNNSSYTIPWFLANKLGQNVRNPSWDPVTDIRPICESNPRNRNTTHAKLNLYVILVQYQDNLTLLTTDVGL